MQLAAKAAMQTFGIIDLLILLLWHKTAKHTSGIFDEPALRQILWQHSACQGQSNMLHFKQKVCSTVIIQSNPAGNVMDI